jgi:copper ion binding protein
MNKEKYSTNLTSFVSSLAFFLIFLFATGCSQQESGQQEPAAGNTKEMTLPIEGMSCNSCVANVKSTLKPMEGVEKVAVSLQERNATISFDPEKITPAQVQKAINDLGYKAGEAVTTENK